MSTSNDGDLRGGINNSVNNNQRQGILENGSINSNMQDRSRIVGLNRDNGTQDTKIFKGETSKMNGHVFQLHAKMKNKSQFSNTINALRMYASSVYTNNIESMNIMFTEVEEPSVLEPKGPE